MKQLKKILSWYKENIKKEPALKIQVRKEDWWEDITLVSSKGTLEPMLIQNLPFERYTFLPRKYSMCGIN